MLIIVLFILFVRKELRYYSIVQRPSLCLEGIAVLRNARKSQLLYQPLLRQQLAE